jgi:large conductance mechanosensitive channel
MPVKRALQHGGTHPAHSAWRALRARLLSSPRVAATGLAGKVKMSIIKEFREFAIKGNVVDMAVGVIIGAAFGKIVTSLVTDVVMPPIGALIGGVDFSRLAITVVQGSGSTPAVVVSYGRFVQTVVDFAIVAAVIFAVVKGINSIKKKAEAAPAAPPAQEVLLAEIRDLLRK